MGLRERVASDCVAAYKARDQVRLDALRMLKAALKNREIEVGPLPEEEALKVLSTQIKQRRQSIESFEQAGRKDLADKERSELGTLEAYLPKQIGADELLELARQAVAEVGGSSAKDVGEVMKALMPKVRGAADGKTVNELVRKLLG